MSLLSIPQFDYEVTINFIIGFEFPIYFANWLWIDYTRFDYHYLLREFTTHTLIRDMAMTSLSIFWFDYEFIIYLAIWLWNQCAFNEISMNALSFSKIYFEFNMFFANLLYWFLYLFRFLTMNPLSISWFDYEYTIQSRNYYGFTCYNAIWLWIQL